MMYTPRLPFIGAALLTVVVGCSKSDDPCDLEAPDCPEDTVCLEDDEGEGFCADTCDPLVVDACTDNQVCNAVLDDAFACFDPVFIEGNVFDSVDSSAIEGAQVMSADVTGSVVTDVALTDAAGDYRLGVPVTRDRSGELTNTTFTLRVNGQGYLGYPSGTRPALPIATNDATYVEEGQHFILSNATTDVSLILHPVQGLFSISGTVGGESPGGSGALVVAECDAPPCPFSYAATSGGYTIFNVADGSYSVAAYKAGLDVGATPTTVAGAPVSGVDLAAASAGLFTVEGSINPVEGAGPTSVVLIPESTFVAVPITLVDGVTVLPELIVRGEIAPGLRAPEPGTAPNITGSYSIPNVPAGNYAVLAGFENDDVCRDPDTNQAGTEVVFITLPDDISGGGSTLTVDTAFKVNPSLVMTRPGAVQSEPVVVGDPLTLEWVDDAGEDHYELFVVNALGEDVWQTSVPKNTESVLYAGPTLELGMYYQWKVISIAVGGNPIGVTEDLLGVFYGVESAD